MKILVAGAGLAGCCSARYLAEQGHEVVVADPRQQIGGNAADGHDDHGVFKHLYGPHIFHTSLDEVWEFLSRFTDWIPYQHKVLSKVGNGFVPMPVNATTIEALTGRSFMNGKQVQEHLDSVRTDVFGLDNAKGYVISKVGIDLYEQLYRRYTAKQWATDPSNVPASVVHRLPIRTDRNDRYFNDKHEALPKDGYTMMMERMLDHPSIHVELGCTHKEVAWNRRQFLIYTGPIDAFFGYSEGKLPYRRVKFVDVSKHSVDCLQPSAVVNYTDDQPYTRSTEWRQMTGQEHDITTLTYEIPSYKEGIECYPTKEGEELYQKYKRMLIPATLLLGRLATYRYMNMDQVVAQCLHVLGQQF